MKSNDNSPILRRKKGTSNEELATQLADIANYKKIDLSKYIKDNPTADVVDYIQVKLLAGYNHFILPNGAKLNKELTLLNTYQNNITGIIFEGAGVQKSDLLLNTGGVGIRVSGSINITFKNMALTSKGSGVTNPSTLGILLQRSAIKDVCQWNNLDNVTIDMHTDMTANGGVGTVGLYNNTAELATYHNLTVYADLPCVLSRGDIYNLANAHFSLSMKDVAFTGSTSLIASGSHALVLDGVSNITFDNLYVSRNMFYGSNTQSYAILVTGKSDYGYENYNVQMLNYDCEVFPQSMKVIAKLRASKITGNHQSIAAGSDVVTVDTNGQLTNCEIFIHVVSEGGVFNLINFLSTSAGAVNCIFHFMDSNYKLTYSAAMLGCMVYSNNLPTLTNTNSSASSIFVVSKDGVGLGTNLLKYSYGKPTRVSENAGSVAFRTDQGGGQGYPVGWVYNGVDYISFGQVGYQQSAGTPVGVLTPRQVGEEAFDSTNKHWYKSVGLTNADWKQISN